MKHVDLFKFSPCSSVVDVLQKQLHYFPEPRLQHFHGQCKKGARTGEQHQRGSASCESPSILCAPLISSPTCLLSRAGQRQSCPPFPPQCPALLHSWQSTAWARSLQPLGTEAQTQAAQKFNGARKHKRLA